jgi:hypothetical protein
MCFKISRPRYAGSAETDIPPEKFQNLKSLREDMPPENFKILNAGCFFRLVYEVKNITIFWRYIRQKKGACSEQPISAYNETPALGNKARVHFMRLTRQSPVDGVEIPKLREAVSRKFGTY